MACFILLFVFILYFFIVASRHQIVINNVRASNSLISFQLNLMLFVVERSLADNQSNGYILSLDIVNQRKLERRYLEKVQFILKMVR